MKMREAVLNTPQHLKYDTLTIVIKSTQCLRLCAAALTWWPTSCQFHHFASSCHYLELKRKMGAKL